MRKWYWAGGLLLFANVADVWTTMLSGGQEQNPFMRDDNYQPVLSHVLFAKFMLTAIAVLMAIAGWQLTDNKWLRGAISWALIARLFYWTYDMLMAALVNYQIHVGWYKP